MSIVKTFNLKKDFSDLETAYKNIYDSDNILSFQLGISKSIKILSYLAKFVRNKTNIFSKNMPTDLLIHIFSFLPKKYMFSNLRTCKIWNKILTNPVQIILYKHPIDYNINNDSIGYLWTKRIEHNDKYIFISNLANIKCYNENLEIVSTIDIYESLFATNNNYLCYCTPEGCVSLYSFKKKKIVAEWTCRFVVTLSMSEKYICITYTQGFNVYDFKGCLLKTWGLKIHDIHGNVNIAMNDDEIFLTDLIFDYIQVFSCDGKFLRKIDCYNPYLKKSYKPRYITISNNIICVTSSGGHNILVFHYNGKFLFQINSCNLLSYITCFKNKLFASCYSGTVSIYNLLYNKKK
jgi:hypothetical protein